MSTTELVPSVSIDNLVNQRAAVMERMRQAIALMQEAADIAAVAHLGMPRVNMGTGFSRSSSEVSLATSQLGTDRAGSRWEHKESPQDAIERMLRLGVDSAAWQYLMHESGMRTLMDAKARSDWDKAISEGDIPELTAANIRSTFGMLHNSRGEIFERGVIACFQGLAWDYKTNLPQKFGKRIVITYLRGSMSPGKWGGSDSLGHPHYERCNLLDDLTRVFTVLDGKPEPDHRQGWYGRISRCNRTDDPLPADDYLQVKTFRNGNAHITFLRPDLVDKMNKIIAKHYPGALPAPK